MNYIAVTNPEEAAKIEQDVYKHMPTIIVANGQMVRVLAQINGNVYYKDFTEEV